MQPETIGFIGLGLIGGSIAKTIHRIFPEIRQIAFDISEETLAQAREEGVLEEVVIIAAGLSIQDPRERPTEQRAQAETAHKEFEDYKAADIAKFFNPSHKTKVFMDLKGIYDMKDYKSPEFNYWRL